MCLLFDFARQNADYATTARNIKSINLCINSTQIKRFLTKTVIGGFASFNSLYNIPTFIKHT